MQWLHKTLFILAFPSLGKFETSKLPAIFYIKGTQEMQDLLYCVAIALLSSSDFFIMLSMNLPREESTCCFCTKFLYLQTGTEAKL